MIGLLVNSVRQNMLSESSILGPLPLKILLRASPSASGNFKSDHFSMSLFLYFEKLFDKVKEYE